MKKTGAKLLLTSSFRKLRLLLLLNYILFFVPLMFLQACGSSNERDQSEPTDTVNKKLQSVSTIRVNGSGIQLLDYSNQTEKLLAYNKYSKALLILDKNGTILSEKNLLGDGPEEVGSAINAAIFVDKKRIAVGNQKGIWIYNLELEFLDSYKMNSSFGLRPVGFLDNRMVALSLGETLSILKSDCFRIPMKPYQPGFLAKEKITKKITLNNNETIEDSQELMGTNIYDSNETFYPYFAPILAKSEKETEFLMALPYEQTIYKMSAEKNNWTPYISNLDLFGLSKAKGVPFDELNKNINPSVGMSDQELLYVQTNGRILRLFKSDRYVATVHLTSLPEKHMPAKPINLLTLSKKYQSIYLTLYESGEKLFEADISDYRNWKNMLMIDDHTFLVEKLIESDVEPDETVFQVLSLR